MGLYARVLFSSLDCVFSLPPCCSHVLKPFSGMWFLHVLVAAHKRVGIVLLIEVA